MVQIQWAEEYTSNKTNRISDAHAHCSSLRLNSFSNSRYAIKYIQLVNMANLNLPLIIVALIMVTENS